MNAQTLRFSSEYENIGPICAELIEIVSASLDSDKLLELQIALSEALNNVIEHSYAEQEGRPVVVQWCVGKDTVSISIKDQGQGMPGGWVAPKARVEELSLENMDALPEGGMGMQLIEGCVDELSYEKTETHNVLTFTKFK